MKYTFLRSSMTWVFLLIFFVMVCFHTPFLSAQNQKIQNSISVSEFVSRVVSQSNEMKLIELESHIAYQTKKLSWAKLVFPSLDLKLYPFGYDNTNFNTFISQYGPNPDRLEGKANPFVLSGFQPFSVNREYFIFGEGLEFRSPTPLGGALGFNVDHFFLINFDKKDYRQRIKFDFTISQPLLVNNILFDFRPLYNESTIINYKYDISSVEKINKRNQIIKGAYKQAYSLITLKKQKDLLEKTIIVLKKDLEAMNIRFKNKLVSKAIVQSLEITISEQKQKLRDLTSAYIDLQQNAKRMTASNDFVLFLEEKEFSTKDALVQNNFSENSIEKNHRVKKKYLEYQIASKGIFSKEIASRPMVNFKLSLEPRYRQPRLDSDDFWKSFTDFYADGSTVDINFSMVFKIPLLTGAERKYRRMLDILSVEVYRRTYEQELAEVRREVEHKKKQYDDIRKKRNEIEREVSLQRVFLNEKDIQLKQGTTSEHERLRQELQLLKVLHKEWEVQEKMLLLAIDILDTKGVDLGVLL